MIDRFSELESRNKRNQTRADFDKLALPKLKDVSDSDLAWIQSCYDPQDPQYIFIQNIWDNRLLASQLKSTRYAAWAGIGGTIIGVLLGYLLK